MNFSFRIANKQKMSDFGKKSYRLIACFLTTDPSLNLLFGDKAIFILRPKIGWRINIRKTFVIVGLFPMKNIVRLKVLVFMLGLFNFLLFSLLSLKQGFLLPQLSKNDFSYFVWQNFLWWCFFGLLFDCQITSHLVNYLPTCLLVLDNFNLDLPRASFV